MTVASVSAVVPAYNAELYVAETLEAILSQTRPPDEVIVVDDGSTDGTPDELARFRGEIRVVRQANQGTAGALTTGFELARCTYAAGCAADDIWEATKLERQVAALVTHPEIDVAFTGARVFGAVDRPFAEYVGGTPPPPGLVVDRPSFARSLYRANMICASSGLVRLSLQRRLGPFAELTEDYDLWLRALRAGAVFFYDPVELVRYRRHDKNVSLNASGMYEATHSVHKRYEDVVDGPLFVRKVLAGDHFRLAMAYLAEDRTASARRSIRASLLHWPKAQTVGWAALLLAPARYRDSLLRRLRRGMGSLSRREAAPTLGDT
jgi:glycosyltransferase involved in cell wall biosynthesis